MFWDFLYQLQPRDQALPQLLYVLNAGADSGLKTPCTVVHLVVPDDQVFILATSGVAATPAAATNLQRITVIGLAPDGSRSVTLLGRDFTTPGPSITTTFDYNADFAIVPSGWSVRSNAAYSAITGNNQLSAQITGFLIPRGNLLVL